MNRDFSKWEKSAKTDPKRLAAVADRLAWLPVFSIKSGKSKRPAFWPGFLLLLAGCTVPAETPSTPPRVDSAISWPIEAPPEPAHKPKPARPNLNTGKAASDEPPAEATLPPLPPCPEKATSPQKQILQKLDCLIRIEEQKPNGNIINGN